jgi:hypothetical protein
MYSYAIVHCSFSAWKIAHRENKTRNFRGTGDDDDSRVHEAILDDYELQVGGLNPRLVTGGVPIRDQLSAVVAPVPETSSETALFVSDLQDANKKWYILFNFLVTFWRNIYIWISNVVAKKASL